MVVKGDFALGTKDTPRVRALLTTLVSSLTQIQQTGPAELGPLAGSLESSVTAILDATDSRTPPEGLVSLINSVMTQQGTEIATFLDQAAMACGATRGADLRADAVIIRSD